MGKVGYRFLPTEQELVGHFLYSKITENPILDDDDDDPVSVCDLYGDQEPWDIWDFHGGNGLLKDEALYFFTRLKKLSPNGSRFSRKIASGVWQGEDGAKAVVGRDDSDKILGFRKRFRYENINNSEQNGGWIMYEYTINSSLLDEKYKHKAIDYVLCSMKKNESGQQKEKSGLGKQTKFKQIGETTQLGQRAPGRKRKLKQADKPNNRDDRDDEADDCVQNKRLKAEQQALLMQPAELSSASNFLEVVESEAGTESCSDTLEVADLLPDTNQTAEVDWIEYHIPKSHHQHQMSEVETERCSAADLVPNTNERAEVDCVEYYIPEGHQQHLMSEQEALQVFEYESETEPVFDFGGIFSNIGYDFDQVFTSSDLESLGTLPD